MRAASLFTTHEARGCMPYVRRHTLKPMVIYAVHGRHTRVSERVNSFFVLKCSLIRSTRPSRGPDWRNIQTNILQKIIWENKTEFINEVKKRKELYIKHFKIKKKKALLCSIKLKC